jgi:hypothetical protein
LPERLLTAAGFKSGAPRASTPKSYPSWRLPAQDPKLGARILIWATGRPLLSYTGIHIANELRVDQELPRNGGYDSTVPLEWACSVGRQTGCSGSLFRMDEPITNQKEEPW